MPTLKTCLATLLAAAGIAAAGTSCAQWPTSRLDVEIYDRTEGRILPMYTHEGRRYVIGKPGNEYAIRVRNAGAERLLAVMSVDGVNVITGDTAAPAQSGYVLAGGESADIAGWRKDMTRTAAFYFTALPDSYAARTGRPDNVGVIGVAVFRERPRAIPYNGPLRRERDAAESADRAAAPGSAAQAPAAPLAEQKLGTGHGRGESSYAQYTTFERASNTPAETIAIYYDSYQNLLAQGVPVASPRVARIRPDPFPDRGRFVPDPR